MRELVKRIVERMPGPLPLAALDAIRYVRYPQIRRTLRAEKRILAKLGRPNRVLQGPFVGMQTISRAYCSAMLPKTLGTYEREIAAAVETICQAGCDVIVDIGAAEGYYAVGMALRNPRARIVAFELASAARYDLKRLAQRNGVSGRIELCGECTSPALGESLAGAERPAVICDCEGAEDRLLDPDLVPELRQALILVETHEGMFAGINDRLRERFAPTHLIEAIPSQPRNVEDLPADAHLAPAEAEAALSENRAWAEWFFLVPKTDPR
jgi:hypothetical protein